MSTFNYKIEVLPEVDNVWADLLSRWGIATAASCQRSLAIQILAMKHVSPLTSPDFVWPSQAEIIAVQRAVFPLLGGEAARLKWNEDAGYYISHNKKIWLAQAEPCACASLS